MVMFYLVGFIYGFYLKVFVVGQVYKKIFIDEVVVMFDICDVFEIMVVSQVVENVEYVYSWKG